MPTKGLIQTLPKGIFPLANFGSSCEVCQHTVSDYHRSHWTLPQTERRLCHSHQLFTVLKLIKTLLSDPSLGDVMPFLISHEYLFLEPQVMEIAVAQRVPVLK